TQLSHNQCSATVQVNGVERFIGQECVQQNPTMTIDPNNQNVCNGKIEQYYLLISNNDGRFCTPTTFNVSLIYPEGIIGNNEFNITLQPQQTYYPIPLPFNAPVDLPPGDYNITIEIVDTQDPSRQFTAFANFIVVLDTEPPTISILSPTTDENLFTISPRLTSGELSGNMSDECGISFGDGIVQYPQNTQLDFMFFGQESWQHNYPIELEPGQNIIIVTAHDGIDNTSSDTLTITREINWNDTTPPTLQLYIMSPAYGNTRINAFTTDVLNGIDNVQFFIDEELKFIDNLPEYDDYGNVEFYFDWNSFEVPNGSHTIKVISTDDANNSTTKTTTITVDNDPIPPTIAITNPQPNSIVSGTVNIRADASDNRAILRVIFFVDDYPVGEFYSPPYSVNWNSTTVPNGIHTIKAEVTDIRYNTATDSINVTVNN
ncbi:MAG: Ig-like domain-containing protein, partial [archaeon]|nr:Ig-like domain-containing protein [archaeon]